MYIRADSTENLFQPFLRFNGGYFALVLLVDEFQPFLRFNQRISSILHFTARDGLFQPFLRFNGSCVRLLWVFKFFFGFL